MKVYSFSPFSSPSVFGASSPSSIAFRNSSQFGLHTASSTHGMTTGSTFGTQTGTFCALPPGASSLESLAPSFGPSLPSRGTFGRCLFTFGFPSVFEATSLFGDSSANLKSKFNPFGSANTFGLQPSSGSTFGTQTGTFCVLPPGATALEGLAPSFGASSMPALGSSLFGQQPTTGAFTSNSNQSSPFGISNAFSLSTTFGATCSPSVGHSSIPAFCSTSSSPAISGSALPAAFGSQSSSPAFGCASSTSSSGFGNSTFVFGCTLFGKAQPFAFGIQSTQFGTQIKMPEFSQTDSDNQQGSRVIPYAAVQEDTEKFMSISFMLPCKDRKSHEELRWEDYQRGDKGGAQVQTQSIPFGFGQPATTANSFGSRNTSTPFDQPASASPFWSPNSSQPAANTSAFGSTTANSSLSWPAAANASPFGSTDTSTPFSQLAANSSAFGSTNRSNASFGYPAAISRAFGSTNTTDVFGQPAPSIFGSSNTSSSFGQPASSNLFGTTNTASSSFGQSSAPNLSFNSQTVASGFGSSSTPSFSSNSAPSGFSRTTTSSLFGSTPSVFGSNASSASTSNAFTFCSNFGQTHSGNATQSTASMHSSPQPNAVMQMFTPNFSTVSSTRQGIANKTVREKLAPVKFSHLLKPRHLFRARIKLPARKYYPKAAGERGRRVKV